MSKTPRPPIVRSTATDRRYARCLVSGGHRYGVETVSRDYAGYPVELRVCRRCQVPEKPRLRTTSMSLIQQARAGGVSSGHARSKASPG